MVKIAVVVGSTRPGRRSRQVADWVMARATSRGGAEFEMLDLADYSLPLLDEPMPPSLGNYQHEHTEAWARAVPRFDGFIFVTAEYNHSVPGVLKNALDFLYAEWNNKAAGFVSYGSAGGVRAAPSPPTSKTSRASLQARPQKTPWSRCWTSSFPGQRRSSPSAHKLPACGCQAFLP